MSPTLQPTETPGDAPWYLPLADEVQVFEAAYAARIPVLLQGPTGCGKTRFVQHMAWRLQQAGPAGPSGRAAEAGIGPGPSGLITVACHEDLTASDLIGRHLLLHDRTVWADGPLTRAVRSGALCYLDEVVEARQDTTVVIHALADHRRQLPIDKTGELLQAHQGFLLVLSYNPGYQSSLKDLKPSTRQRFVCLAFTHPDVEQEAQIVAREGGIAAAQAQRLAALAQAVRRLDSTGAPVDLSTRLLIHAAQLIGGGIAPRRACEVAVTFALGDDNTLREAVAHLVAAHFA